MLTCHSRALRKGDLGARARLVLVTEGDAWPETPWGAALSRRFPERGPALAQLADADDAWAARLEGAGHTGFPLLEAARKTLAPLLEREAPCLEVLLPPVSPSRQAQLADAVVSAYLCGVHRLPRFGREAASLHAPAPELRLWGTALRAEDLAWSVACAEGTNLARDLTALPSNELTPGAYRERIEALARAEGWEMRFFDLYRLRDLGAGAFLAVARAGAHDDAGIVHLRYRPAADVEARPTALVGKGVCFDSGGLQLKGARHMFGMHTDMAGSAAALGSLLALTRLRHPRPVDCWLALAENGIGPQAYRPNEVVTALDGTTIEIVHTDAEGRLLLADTLALAARHRPACLIDLATLTGSCVQALGDRYCGAFAHPPELAEAALEAGRASGERAWPFPMDPDYDEALESEVADLKQCTLDTQADHILAARFLARFVPDTLPWLHLDLAPVRHKGGLGHVPGEITGFGVRLVTQLIRDRDSP